METLVDSDESEEDMYEDVQAIATEPEQEETMSETAETDINQNYVSVQPPWWDASMGEWIPYFPDDFDMSQCIYYVRNLWSLWYLLVFVIIPA